MKIRSRLWFVVVVLALSGWFATAFGLGTHSPSKAGSPASVGTESSLEVATFGSGCFWCTEADFDKVDGVVSTISGYMGGTTANPTYEAVSAGGTGHVEVLQVTYDPAKVSYATLLDYYWRHTDVLDGGGQFCDRGAQYRPVIFTHSPDQSRLAQDSKTALNNSGRFAQPIAVEIVEASTFTPAEDYHQDYYRKNPLLYRYYRYTCGRDARIKQLWGHDATN